MQKRKLLYHYLWLINMFAFFVIVGCFVQPPQEIIQGFFDIILGPSVLVADYIEIGGLGATYINAGLLGLSVIALLMHLDMKPNGLTMLAIFCVFGFSFFGKNLFNVWPVILGTFLYSKYKDQPFRNFVIIGLLSTSLSPTVNQVFLLGGEANFVTILLAVGFGVGVGFIMPPIATHCMKMHEGFILTNAGFASGFVAILFVSLFRAFGIELVGQSVWSTGYTWELAITLTFVFLSMIFIGFIKKEEDARTLIELSNETGRLVTDFYILYGKHLPLINMGMLGLLTLWFTVFWTGTLNGPYVAGILSITGFAAFGLNIKNMWPVMLGALIGSALIDMPYNTNIIMVIVLFSTALAPFAGYYGPIWGIIAGFIHLAINLNLSSVTAGINLYNNGFIAGIVVICLLPLASSLRNDYR